MLPKIASSFPSSSCLAGWTNCRQAAAFTSSIPNHQPRHARPQPLYVPLCHCNASCLLTPVGRQKYFKVTDDARYLTWVPSNRRGNIGYCEFLSDKHSLCICLFDVSPVDLDRPFTVIPGREEELSFEAKDSEDAKPVDLKVPELSGFLMKKGGVQGSRLKKW